MVCPLPCVRKGSSLYGRRWEWGWVHKERVESSFREQLPREIDSALEENPRSEQYAVLVGGNTPPTLLDTVLRDGREKSRENIGNGRKRRLLIQGLKRGRHPLGDCAHLKKIKENVRTVT